MRKNKKKKGKKKKKINNLPENSIPNPTDNPLKEKQQNRILAEQRITSFSGPIPHPEILAQYDKIVQNGAERIIAMAESQSSHRQHLEKWAVIGGTILAYLGVFAALVISLCVLYFSYLLMMAGHPVAGTLLSGGSLAGLVSSFIYGTRTRKEERLRKDQNSRK